jgi:hypothetical protein
MCSGVGRFCCVLWWMQIRSKTKSFDTFGETDDVWFSNKLEGREIKYGRS